MQHKAFIQIIEFKKGRGSHTRGLYVGGPCPNTSGLTKKASESRYPETA